MNVQSIRLENWKKFTSPVEIELGNGLNILYGPNESGKSTIIDSIITTFYSKHTSGSGRIRSLKPWGSSLKPRSTITFQKDGQKYRITKGFHEKISLLEKMDGGNWRKIAEGDKADQELIQLVGGQLSPRGDTKPELWGLGQTLWMVQGQPIISDDLNDETLSSLQAMVGATIESEKEKKVLGEIRSRFLDIFTEKKRTLKKGCELFKIKEEISSLKKELNKSEQDKTRIDELIREIEDNEFLLNRNKLNLKEATQKRDQNQVKVEEARRHRENREKLEHEIRDIRTEYETLNQKIKEIDDSKAEINKIKSENEEIKQQIDPLESEFKELNEEIKRKLSDLKELNEKFEKTNAEKSMVGIAHTTVMDEQALESMKKNYNEISGLYDDLTSAQEEYNTIIAPEAAQMKKIEKLYRDIHDTQTKLQVMGLSVTATPKVKISGKISQDNEETSFSLKENDNVSWTANQSLNIKIDQVGEFQVKSGSQDVKVMKRELEDIKSQYQELVAPYGTEDLNDLKGFIIRKEAKEKDLKRIKADIEKKSDKSKEELQKEIMEFENKIKLNWSKIPDNSPYKNNADMDKSVLRTLLSKKIKQLEEDIKRITQNQKNLNYEIEADRKIAKDLEKRINNLKTDFHGKNEIIGEIRKRIKRLEDDGLTNDERNRQLNQLSFDLEQKDRAWQVYQDEIEDKENQPIGEYKGLKSKVEMLEKEIQKQEISKAENERELQMLINQSKDTTIVEEKLEQLQLKEKKLETDAEALKLLFDLTSFYRENIIGELSKPIHKRVTEDLEKLLGPKYSLIFNKEMKPDTVIAHGEEAPIDLLSFGTQEQVWCIFRLALGNILSRDERQLVVLDDPLVNTDPVRMHHALEILQDNAENMQIIVVTCDVDKYNSLTDANFISMDDTLRR
ncbi:MAG: AAA family ATPase [Methanobacteriaceae archaeon]|nr:AAA family ATPase [Methanobacteriaceae archaeon]